MRSSGIEYKLQRTWSTAFQLGHATSPLRSSRGNAPVSVRSVQADKARSCNLPLWLLAVQKVNFSAASMPTASSPRTIGELAMRPHKSRMRWLSCAQSSGTAGPRQHCARSRSTVPSGVRMIPYSANSDTDVLSAPSRSCLAANPTESPCSTKEQLPVTKSEPFTSLYPTTYRRATSSYIARWHTRRRQIRPRLPSTRKRHWIEHSDRTRRSFGSRHLRVSAPPPRNYTLSTTVQKSTSGYRTVGLWEPIRYLGNFLPP